MSMADWAVYNLDKETLEELEVVLEEAGYPSSAADVAIGLICGWFVDLSKED